MEIGRTGEMRKAVAAGDWAAVVRLWEAYAAGLLDEIGRGTCTPARMAEAGEFLAWAKRSALCARAHAQTRLDRIHAARQYGARSAPPPPSVSASL
ncbi:MAG TPA: hypothetical protein VMB03_27200 [Bryobacteraceae bacterium]|nr:hypothetical protein [Bryobacteraceae bacterium]